MEADFQGHYAVDLREALWGESPIGSRRLLSLIKGLPHGSAIQRALYYEDKPGAVGKAVGQPVGQPTQSSPQEVKKFLGQVVVDPGVKE